MKRNSLILIAFAALALLLGTVPANAHDPLLDQIGTQISHADDAAVKTTTALGLANAGLVRTNDALEQTNAKYKDDIAKKDAQITSLTKDNTRLTAQNANQATAIDGYEHEWFSPIQHRLFWLFVICWVLYIVLKILAGQNLTVGGFGIGGLVSGVAELIFAVGTGGTSLLSLIFHNLWFRFWACEQSFVAWITKKTASGTWTAIKSPFTLGAALVSAVAGKAKTAIADGEQEMTYLIHGHPAEPPAGYSGESLSHPDVHA